MNSIHRYIDRHRANNYRIFFFFFSAKYLNSCKETKMEENELAWCSVTLLLEIHFYAKTRIQVALLWRHGVDRIMPEMNRDNDMRQADLSHKFVTCTKLRNEWSPIDSVLCFPLRAPNKHNNVRCCRVRLLWTAPSIAANTNNIAFDYRMLLEAG